MVQRDLEAVWVDVVDYGEVVVGAQGVVGVLVEGGGWGVYVVVAVGESVNYQLVFRL